MSQRFLPTETLSWTCRPLGSTATKDLHCIDANQLAASAMPALFSAEAPLNLGAKERTNCSPAELTS
eukprot:4817331-Pyramimonas_sp.AAC.1